MDLHLDRKRPPRRLGAAHVLGLLAALTAVLLVLAGLHGGAERGTRLALLGSGTAAAATAIGTLPVLFSQDFSKKTYDCFLGFGGGVMLGATAFSLIVPALDAAREHGVGPLAASAMLAAGILAGMVLIIALDHFVQQRMPDEASVPVDPASLKRAWVFVSAVALHNLPEGLAIGVAYGGPDVHSAHSLATGISIQDVPEGLVVALALRGVGYGKWLSAGLGGLSGLVEPLMALFGVSMIGLATGMLPFWLATAAGAMLFVIVHDVIHEMQASGHRLSASVALVVGFIVMTVLDTGLG